MSILDEFCTKYSNWGKWGADDQKGTTNYITADKILSAMQLPKKGQVISLALPYDGNGPQTGTFGRVNPIHQMLVTGVDHASGRQMWGDRKFPHGLGYADDTIFMPLQCGTQWDALSHIFHHGKMWNGYPAEEVSSSGAKRNGIEHLRETLVGRGVLLDIARYKEVPCLSRQYAVTGEDLEGAAKKQGVEVREGDILLVRTGETGRARREGWTGYAGGDSPGLSFYSAPWIYEKRVAAVVLDTWGMEVRPNELPDSFQPLHLVLIVHMGLTVGEIFYLDELADACAEDGRYEFLFAGPPLPFTGAVGSPLNPLAIR